MKGLSSKHHVEGGLFLDNVDAVIRNPRWELWDADGTISPPVVALAFEAETEEQEPSTQYYSLGSKSAENFEPSEDGDDLTVIGERGQVSKSCRASIFLTALEAAGFDGERLDEEPITCIANLKCHFVIQEPPKSWSTISNNDETEGERKKPRGTPVPSKILEEDVPELEEVDRGKKSGKKGAKKTAKKSAKKGAKATSKKAAKKSSKKGAKTVDLPARAEKAVLAVLNDEEEGWIYTDDMPNKLESHLEDDPYCDRIVGYAFQEEWYTDEDRPWVYDSGDDTIALPEDD